MSNLDFQRDLISAHDPTLPMAQLWKPLAQQAWERCHEEARQILRDLTVGDLLAWMCHAVPEEATDWVSAKARRLTDAEFEHAATIGAALPKPTKDLLMRLYKVADDRYLDFAELIAEAQSGSTCGLTIAEKNASKTSWYEDAAGAYLSLRLPQAHVLRLAARQTRLSVRFNGDGVPMVNAPARGRKVSKDADLAVVLPPVDGNSTVLLISHKYARAKGGHQDNQKADAETFLLQAASGLGTPIEELTDMVRALTGDPDRTVSWEPALVLDGSYFSELAADGPQEHHGRRLFVGTTDDLVAEVTARLAT